MTQRFHIRSAYTAVIPTKREEERERKIVLKPSVWIKANCRNLCICTEQKKKRKFLPSVMKRFAQDDPIAWLPLASSRTKRWSDVHSINLDNYIYVRPSIVSHRTRVHRFTFSFLPFCTCAHLLVHGAVRRVARRAAYSTYGREIHTKRCTRYFLGRPICDFFPQTPYDSPCWLYNSNLGAFLSRIIGYTLFCAPLK